jgi:hypothetical protein
MRQHVEHWIPVKTSSGMFSSEYAISLTLADGQKVSFYVDKGLIRESAGDFLLRVVLVDNYPDQNKQRVLLPIETFETATRWVEVPSK